MTVVKAAEAAQDKQEKRVFNFLDIAAEAKRIIAEAKRNRDKMIHDAREQIDRSHSEAKVHGHKEGYEQGLAEGAKKGHAQALKEARENFAKSSGDALSVLKGAFEQYDQMKTKLLWHAEQASVDLVVKIAEKVIKRSVGKNGEITTDNLRAALELVTQTDNLIVKVNPSDMEHLKEMTNSDESVFGKYKNINIEPDKEVDSGGCRVLTENGEIDAQLDTQLNKIAEELVMTNV